VGSRNDGLQRLIHLSPRERYDPRPFGQDRGHGVVGRREEEQIQPKRFLGQLSDAGGVRGDLSRREAAAAQHPEPAGVADRRDQLRRRVRRTHASLHHRMVHPDQGAKRRRQGPLGRRWESASHNTTSYVETGVAIAPLEDEGMKRQPAET
jgi:hypothetical protein